MSDKNVEDFADTILGTDTQEIIAWAESEIREYKKLITILKKRVKRINKDS